MFPLQIKQRCFMNDFYLLNDFKNFASKDSSSSPNSSPVYNNTLIS